MLNKLLILLFFLSSISISYADSRSPQVGEELWSNFELSKGFGDYTLIFKQDLRTKTSFAEQFKATNTYLGASYKINKYLKVSSYFRYVYKLDNKSYPQFLLVLSPKYNFKWLTFKSRLRYQYINKETPENLFRTRLGLEKKITKYFIPFINYELFYRFNKAGSENILNNQRFEIGNKININKRHSLGLSYRYDSELNKIEVPNRGKWAEDRHIIKLAYAISL